MFSSPVCFVAVPVAFAASTATGSPKGSFKDDCYVSCCCSTGSGFLCLLSAITSRTLCSNLSARDIFEYLNINNFPLQVPYFPSSGSSSSPSPFLINNNNLINQSICIDTQLVDALLQ